MVCLEQRYQDVCAKDKLLPGQGLDVVKVCTVYNEVGIVVAEGVLGFAVAVDFGERVFGDDDVLAGGDFGGRLGAGIRDYGFRDEVPGAYKVFNGDVLYFCVTG